MEKGYSVRKPVVAGSFYPGNNKALKRLIEDCFNSNLGPGALPQVNATAARQIIGLVSPHAGFMYSGPVAAHGFFKLASQGKPERIVILGPNHHGSGAPLALSGAEEWETPMGRVEVDGEGVKNLLAKTSRLKKDDSAHAYEHSLEVQLPFLQYLYGDSFRIIPIAMGWQELAISLELGRSIAAAFSLRDTLVIASSDFTHYESQASASKKDAMAIQAIEKLDTEGLASVVERYNITACGVGPIIAMLIACMQWGTVEANLLRYATSGDVSGDYSHVVGYASVEVKLKNGEVPTK